MVWIDSYAACASTFFEPAIIPDDRSGTRICGRVGQSSGFISPISGVPAIGAPDFIEMVAMKWP